MASSKEYLNFILDQVSNFKGISYRAMMCEYIIYYNGKIVGGIYDNRFLVKPVKAAVAMLPDTKMELSYAQPGAEASAQSGAEASPVPGPIASPITVSDIIKGKVTDKDYYVLFDTISDNRKYDGQILLLCLKPRSRKELQELINIKSETYMKTKILKPLLENRYLCLTNPDVPNDMNQKYYTHPSLIKNSHKQD